MRRKPIKTKEDLQHFLDTSAKCFCGKLLTGLHEMNCNAIVRKREQVKTGLLKKRPI